MVIPGLWLEPWVYKVPPNPKISKFVWENSQSPAPNTQDHPGLIQPPDRTCSLTCSLICKNPHVHSWSVPGFIPVQSSPQC